MSKKVQLYSGGLDSYIISKLWKPDVKLYINYGTEQNKQEMKRLPKDVVIKDLSLSEYIQDDGLTTIPLRNLIFAAIAVNYGDIIAIGGLKSDLHYDKKPEFLSKCTEVFNMVLNKERQYKNVEVIAPYAHMTKTELIRAYLNEGYSIEELNNNSWSCYRPVEDKPCGECKACRARRMAIEEALNGQ